MSAKYITTNLWTTLLVFLLFSGGFYLSIKYLLLKQYDLIYYWLIIKIHPSFEPLEMWQQSRVGPDIIGFSATHTKSHNIIKVSEISTNGQNFHERIIIDAIDTIKLYTIEFKYKSKDIFTGEEFYDSTTSLCLASIFTKRMHSIKAKQGINIGTRGNVGHALQKEFANLNEILDYYDQIKEFFLEFKSYPQVNCMHEWWYTECFLTVPKYIDSIDMSKVIPYLKDARRSLCGTNK